MATTHEAVCAEGGESECGRNQQELAEGRLTERLDRGVESGGLRRVGRQRREDDEQSGAADSSPPTREVS